MHRSLLGTLVSCGAHGHQKLKVGQREGLPRKENLLRNPAKLAVKQGDLGRQPENLASAGAEDQGAEDHVHKGLGFVRVALLYFELLRLDSYVLYVLYKSMQNYSVLEAYLAKQTKYCTNPQQGGGDMLDCSGTRSNNFACRAISRSRSNHVSLEKLLAASRPKGYKDALLDLPKQILKQCFRQTDVDQIALESFMYMYVTRQLVPGPSNQAQLVNTVPDRDNPLANIVYYVRATMSGGDYLDSLRASLPQSNLSQPNLYQPNTIVNTAQSQPSQYSSLLSKLGLSSSFGNLGTSSFATNSITNRPGLSQTGVAFPSSYREPSDLNSREDLAQHVNNCLKALVLSFNYFDKDTLRGNYAALVETLKNLIGLHESLAKVVHSRLTSDLDAVYARINDAPSSFSAITLVKDTYTLVKSARPDNQEAIFKQLSFKLQEVQLHIFLIDSILSTARTKCAPRTQQLQILPLMSNSKPNVQVSLSSGITSCLPVNLIVNHGKTLWLLRLIIVGPFTAPAGGKPLVHALPLSTISTDLSGMKEGVFPVYWPSVIDKLNMQDLCQQCIQNSANYEIITTTHNTAPYYREFKSMLDRFSQPGAFLRVREEERQIIVDTLDGYFNETLPSFLLHVCKNSLLNPQVPGLAENSKLIITMLASIESVATSPTLLDESFLRLVEAVEFKKPLDRPGEVPVKDRILKDVMHKTLAEIGYLQFQEVYTVFRNSIMNLYSLAMQEQTNGTATKFGKKDLLFSLMSDVRTTWKSYKKKYMHQGDTSALAEELRKMGARYQGSPTAADFLP